ncbi:MAG: PepSY domain-containing protein [Pseudomonadales bacterium]
MSTAHTDAPNNRQDGRRSQATAALLTLALLLALPLVATDALAASWMRGAPSQVEPQNLYKPPGITLEQATNMVRRETGGRVLSATPVERGGQRGYEIRVLIDGKRVKDFFVDSDGRIRSGR